MRPWPGTRAQAMEQPLWASGGAGFLPHSRTAASRGRVVLSMRRLLSSAERTTPLRLSRTRSHLPKRDEFGLRVVRALPKDSSASPACSRMHV